MFDRRVFLKDEYFHSIMIVVRLHVSKFIELSKS
jgi:hypothetical protein